MTLPLEHQAGRSVEKNSGTYVTNEIWRRVNGQVHPVILRSTIEEYPYHGVGTAFMLEHEGQLFIVSAQHVVNNQYAQSEDFSVFIRNASYSLMFDLEAVFQPNFAPHFDLLIRRVASFQREFLIENGAFWIGTEATIEFYPQVDTFFVFGYSEDHRAYDYELKQISAELGCLAGKLTSPAVPELVTLQIVGEHPASLRGFSGSPVIADIDGEWMFAGMLTLAVETSGVMNFIPGDRIVMYLHELHEMNQAGIAL